MKFHDAAVKVDAVFILAVDFDAGPSVPPQRFEVDDVLPLPRSVESKKNPLHVTLLDESNLATEYRAVAKISVCVPAKYERLIWAVLPTDPMTPPYCFVESIPTRSEREYESTITTVELR